MLWKQNINEIWYELIVLHSKLIFLIDLKYLYKSSLSSKDNLGKPNTTYETNIKSNMLMLQNSQTEKKNFKLSIG